VFESLVWSSLLAPSALDHNCNQSSQFEKLQKTRLNCVTDWSFAVIRLVLTSSGLNWFATGLDRSSGVQGTVKQICFKYFKYRESVLWAMVATILH